jgi:ankyrin repeat protein
MKTIKSYIQFLNEELNILKGPSDDETDEVFNSMTPDDALIWSVKNNLFDYAKKAIDNGANANATIKPNIYSKLQFEYTIIEFAFLYKKLEFIKYLIDNKKINLNKQDEDGYTPLMYVCKYNNFELVKYLVEHGAKVNITNKNGESAYSLGINRKVIREYLHDKLLKNKK